MTAIYASHIIALRGAKADKTQAYINTSNSEKAPAI